MKQLNSVLSMLLMFMLVFTSCSKSTDPKGDDPFVDTTDHSFKSANFVAALPYSDDLLNLANVTCTYTNMEGKTEVVKFEPGTGNTLELNLSSNTLPASFKIEVKVEKNENYEAFLESKETFDLRWTVFPCYVAGWVEQCDVVHELDNTYLNGIQGGDGIDREIVKQDLDNLISLLSFSFSGTFEKNGNGARFSSHLD